MTDAALGALSNTVSPHVPAELVRDFDLFDMVRDGEDIYNAWHELGRSAPPLFFTPRYGGFWVLNDAVLLEQAFRQADIYCSGKGIGIPPNPPEVPACLPIEADDPYHKELRRPLNIALSPKGVAGLAKRAREICIQLINDLKDSGTCDFIRDFSLKMPMELFLRLVDLPSSDREYLLGLAHETLKVADPARRHAAIEELNRYISGWVDKRLAQPGEDFLSTVVNMEIDGRPLTQTERVGYMTTLMLGGLDTVGGMMGMTAMHLATHDAHRRQLREHPEDIPAAIEEMLRRYPLSTFARYVSRDSELGGVQLKEGDRIMLPTIAHGMDEQQWNEPLAVDFGRSTRDHLTFGSGTHRCPGANLARVELRIFIEEWLARIPDFAIAEGAVLSFENGAVTGLKSLPLTWSVAQTENAG